MAERIALNFLQRMSGIATATAAMVAAVQVQALLLLRRAGTPNVIQSAQLLLLLPPAAVGPCRLVT